MWDLKLEKSLEWVCRKSLGEWANELRAVRVGPYPWEGAVGICTWSPSSDCLGQQDGNWQPVKRPLFYGVTLFFMRVLWLMFRCSVYKRLVFIPMQSNSLRSITWSVFTLSVSLL